MTLWDTRAEAILYLENENPERLAVLLNLLNAIDHLVDCYEKHSRKDTYARVCGLTLLKAKHLAVGMFSLALDGLAQESGALMRPFIEYTELLTYFRYFPDHVDDAVADSNKLPAAGERAKAINGGYKDLREYLNLHASHSSYSYYALSHLLEPESFKFKKSQHNVPVVLNTNVKVLSVQVWILLREATLSVKKLNLTEFNMLAECVDTLHLKLLQEFNLNIAE